MAHTYEFAKADTSATVIPYNIEAFGHPTRERMTIIGILRGKDPFKGKRALPGGFLNVGTETLQACARRESIVEEIKNVDKAFQHFGMGFPEENEFQLLTVHSDPHRDPRYLITGAPVIDHVYTLELPYEVVHYKGLKGGDDALEALQRVEYDKDNPPSLGHLSLTWAFDHGLAIYEFMQRIRWIK